MAQTSNQNIAQTSKFPYYHPLNEWLLWATNGNQGQTVTHFQSSKTINHTYNRYKTSKYGSNFKFPIITH